VLFYQANKLSDLSAKGVLPNYYMNNPLKGNKKTRETNVIKTGNRGSRYQGNIWHTIKGIVCVTAKGVVTVASRECHK